MKWSQQTNKWLFICFRNTCTSTNIIEAAVTEGPGGKFNSIMSHILFSKVHQKLLSFSFFAILSHSVITYM